jgi:hypothetical protein
MSAPLRNNEPSLTARDGATVSTAAISEVPWRVAAGAGVVVAGADLVLHVVTGRIGLGGLGSSLSAGTVALLAVAGGGVMVRSQASRAVRWARRNPWRFALLPGVAAAAIVFVLSVALGSGGLFGDVFTAVWHGAVAYGVTGGVGVLAGRRDKAR